jgi:DNA/RNA-binding domain of Phe-tRNA-synthetase-like protein
VHRLTATDTWRSAHPGATIGVLELAGLDNRSASTRLNARKREVEARLRERYHGFSRRDFLALPVIAEYDQYYARFNKTYHVQLQLESIVLKGKALPAVSPAVDANFMAELETLILTAGHDAGKLSGPIVFDVSGDDDHMTQMNGTSRTLQAGDMIMRDADGISCSIIYGQDARSPITPDTTQVLYVAYAPAGVSAATVERQLQEIEANVRLCSADVAVEQQRVLTTSAS